MYYEVYGRDYDSIGYTSRCTEFMIAALFYFIYYTYKYDVAGITYKSHRWNIRY